MTVHTAFPNQKRQSTRDGINLTEEAAGGKLTALGARGVTTAEPLEAESCGSAVHRSTLQSLGSRKS